jgi:hypothetical protein
VSTPGSCGTRPQERFLLYSRKVSLNDEGVKRMAHSTRDKEKLLNRVGRIKGRVEAVARALHQDQECSKVL